MKWEDLYKIKCMVLFVLATLSFAGSIVLYFLEIDSKEYIIGALGLTIIILPLFNIARYGATFSDKFKRLYYILLLIYSIGFLVVIIIMSDFLLLVIVVLAAVVFWTANLCLIKNIYEKIKMISKDLTKLSSIFLFIISGLYYINNPSIALDRGIMPVPESIINMLVGISFLVMLIFTYKIAEYRVATLFSAIGASVFFFIFKADWMLRNFDRLVNGYIGTYLFLAISSLFLFIIVGINCGKLLYDCATLKKAHHSMLFGPWFSNLIAIKNIKRIELEQKIKIKKGFKIVAIFTLFALPGILASMNVYRIPITIKPLDYDVTFNFWASPLIDTAYTTIEKQKMNDHQVNLDIAFYMQDENVSLLKQFEDEMPDITYRITVQPRNISDLYDQVVRLTELLMECETNLTLNQWKGFAFDIEGNAYAWYNAYNSTDDSIAIWNDVFDYIEAKSIERGKKIDMECVNGFEFSVDGLFDGDYDMQFVEGFNSYVPERFSVYAPMVYRCWPTGDVLYGIPQQPLEHWATSYYVYTALYTLQRGIQNSNKMGVYLGITNTSCYSIDIAQTDPATYGQGTGLGNLYRDVLIAKSFGIPEVTFFLQFNANDGQGDFGGTFASYGNDFLDDLNDSVNTNCPEEFNIYYDNLDGAMMTMLGRDLFCNFSNISGLFKIIELVGLTFIFYILLNKKRSKVPNL